MDANVNLIPAEKIGVKESSPKRIASHVDPQSKQIKMYAKAILRFSENN